MSLALLWCLCRPWRQLTGSFLPFPALLTVIKAYDRFGPLPTYTNLYLGVDLLLFEAMIKIIYRCAAHASRMRVCVPPPTHPRSACSARVPSRRRPSWPTRSPKIKLGVNNKRLQIVVIMVVSGPGSLSASFSFVASYAQSHHSRDWISRDGSK